MNLYELNQNIMENVPEEGIPTEEQLKEVIRNFQSSFPSGYYMLLCHSMRYYTVFVAQRPFCQEKFEDLVIECLNNTGKIISVNNEPEALEFWTKDDDAPAECFYLFDYSSGIVPFGG